MKFKPKISLIACVAKDRGIGKDNKLLFNIPEDLKYFQNITRHHTIIMGLNTYYSIGKALPERQNIVLSNKDVDISDATVCRSIEEALEKAKEVEKNEIFFIGGASVYNQAIKFADKLYLTEVDAILPADTFFPSFKEFDKVKVVGSGKHGKLKYRFLELTKGER